MSRCTETLLEDGEVDDEAEAEGQCEFLWNQSLRNGKPRGAQSIVHKVHAGNTGGLNFVLSTSEPDRMGDTIDQRGWRLESFLKNPIALVGHRQDFVIGRWHDIGVSEGQLKGRLELVPRGVSARADEARLLIENDFLRATSVGFRSISSRPRLVDGKAVGVHFESQELLECSVVAIGANASALACKGLNISPAMRAAVFADRAVAKGPLPLTARQVAERKFERAVTKLDQALGVLERLQSEERELLASAAGCFGSIRNSIVERDRREFMILAEHDLEMTRHVRARMSTARARVTIARIELQDAHDVIMRLDGKGRRR